MDNMGYKIGHVKIGSQMILSEDGKERNVSTIEVQISG
jgi:DNA-binding protein